MYHIIVMCWFLDLKDQMAKLNLTILNNLFGLTLYQFKPHPQLTEIQYHKKSRSTLIDQPYCRIINLDLDIVITSASWSAFKRLSFWDFLCTNRTQPILSIFRTLITWCTLSNKLTEKSIKIRQLNKSAQKIS